MSAEKEKIVVAVIDLVVLETAERNHAARADMIDTKWHYKHTQQGNKAQGL